MDIVPFLCGTSVGGIIAWFIAATLYKKAAAQNAIRAAALASGNQTSGQSDLKFYFKADLPDIEAEIKLLTPKDSGPAKIDLDPPCEVLDGDHLRSRLKEFKHLAQLNGKRDLISEALKYLPD